MIIKKINDLLIEGELKSPMINEIKRNCIPFIKEYRQSRSDDILYRGTQKYTPMYQRVTSRLDDRRPKDTSRGLHNELNFYFRRKFGWNVRNGVFTSSDYKLSKEFGDYCYIFLPIGDFEFVWSPEIKDIYDLIDNGRLMSMEDLHYMYTEEDPFIYKIDGVEVPEEDFMYILGLTRYIELEKLRYSGCNDKFKAVNNYLKLDIRPGDEVLATIEEMTFDEWLYEYKSMVGDVYNPEDIIELYKDDDLRDAINSKNEISFRCNEYYLVKTAYADMIKEMLNG